MCLITKTYQEPLIAEEDITVYKIVKDLKVVNSLLFKIITARTKYREFKIRLGKVYKSELEYYTNIFEQSGIVEKGLHSFANLRDCRYILKYVSGFQDIDYHIIECIIPKGSEYYIGTFNYIDSIASSKLKYIRVIETTC